MSFDYTPLIPRIDELFNVQPNVIETNKDIGRSSKHDSSNAILPVGLGLQARRSAVKVDKTIGTEVACGHGCRYLRDPDDTTQIFVFEPATST